MIGKLLRLFLPTMMLLIGLTSCGGGGGAGDNQMAGGGIGGTGTKITGISFGTVSAKGSVFVNGVEFNIDAANIMKDDDQHLSADLLQVGMTVEVHGSINGTTGTAETVLIDQGVRGPLESINPFVVLGQTIVIDGTTKVENNDVMFSTFHKNEVVEVYGLIKGAGTIGATFIQHAPPTTAGFSVRGFINPNTHVVSTKTFQMGQLTVNYTGAATDGLPQGSWENLYLDVSVGDCANPCRNVSAPSVDFEAFSGVSDADQAEMEGFVMQVVSVSPTASEFLVAGLRVATNSATVFSGGIATDIALDARVEVEGPLVGGLLTATKVSFRDVRLEGDATVNTSAGTLTLAGLPGITVQVNSATQFKSGSGLGGVNGKHVRVRGHSAGPGNGVIATEIENRGSPAPRVVLQGPTQSVSNPSFTVLGIAVLTTSGTAFSDASGTSITAAAFFDALKPGDLVKAQGNLTSSNTVTWGEAELED